MTLTAIIISVLAIVAALWLTYTSRRQAPMAAWCALAILMIADANVPTLSTVNFWAIAAAIATIINYMLPASVATSRKGVGYFATAAIAGSLLGLLISEASMIVGTVVGTLIGAIAFSRTPAGREISNPPAKYFNYLCAKGLPTVITVATAALAIIYDLLLIKTLQ